MVKYLKILVIATLFCSPFAIPLTAVAQNQPNDTVAIIKNLQKESNQAISAQKFVIAIKKLQRAKKLSQIIKDTLIQAQVNLNSAQLNYYLGNYIKANEKATAAAGVFSKYNDTLDLGTAFILQGLIYTELNDFKKAGDFLKSATTIFDQRNDESNLAGINLGKGMLELKKNNPIAAVNYFDAALPVFSDNRMDYQLAIGNIYKANALLKLPPEIPNKYFDQAKNAYEIAEQLIADKDYTRLQIELYKTNALIALQEKDIIKAEKYFQLYSTQKDSLYQVYLNVIASEFDSDSNLSDLNEIIAAQQENIEQQAKSIIFNQATTGLSIGLILILALLTLSLYKNNRLRLKANNLLRDKNVELTLSKEKAEKASLAKAQFLSTITHELRTPLYAVTGLTHLMLQEDPSPVQHEHLKSLQFSGEYLLSLINNILDLNKLEANKVEIDKTTFDLKKRLNDVLIALKKSAVDRNNQLTLEYDESIPSQLNGDPLKLSQILINLIGNSIKFTENGEVTVRIKRLDQTPNKIKLHFEIQDNGVGISKKKQKTIFETFSQGSLQINRKFGGTGLGLSIVKNLLELMNSKINLESDLGIGSKFWFNLSLDLVEGYEENSTNKENVYNIDYEILKDKNILVVEDNKINQMITKKILEKNQMNCMVANNGLEALEIVRVNDFDLILMDIHMPGIGGIETTQRIRHTHKHIPIIALTAVTIDENLDDFYRAGFNEIIPKPFKPEEFFEKISRTLLSKQTKMDS